MSLVLAFDFGSTNCRAGLVDFTGTYLLEKSLPSPAGTGSGEEDEVDPTEWWDAAVSCVTALALEAEDLMERVKAIAVCGITRTQIFLNDRNEPLRKAITWRDARSATEAGEISNKVPSDHPEHGHFNAYHPVSRLAWLKKNEPAVMAELAVVLEPKDYINLRLTGTVASDVVSMSRLQASALGAPSPLDLVVGGKKLLPPLFQPTDCIGHVLSGLPGGFGRLPGVPVFCCSTDSWASVVGLGALREGSAYNLSGTTEVLGLMSPRPVQVSGLVTLDWTNSLFQIGGPSQTGANAMAWFAALVGTPHGEDLSELLTVTLDGPRHPQPILFIPHLDGERAPYWDPRLRGAFIGLHRHHKPVDLCWAIMEGIAFHNRVVLERAEQGVGNPADDIRLGGGAAVNEHWSQAKADICGREVLVSRNIEVGLLGAAIVALTGLNVFPSLAHAQTELVQIKRRHRPDAARKSAYDRLFRLYQTALASNTEIFHDLANGGFIENLSGVRD